MNTKLVNTYWLIVVHSIEAGYNSVEDYLESIDPSGIIEKRIRLSGASEVEAREITGYISARWGKEDDNESLLPSSLTKNYYGLNWLQQLKIIAEHTSKENALKVAQEVLNERGNPDGKIGLNDFQKMREKLGCGPTRSK